MYICIKSILYIFDFNAVFSDIYDGILRILFFT